MKSKKTISAIIILSFFISLAAVYCTPSVAKAADTTYTRTYTQMVDYNYGEKNKGFYMVPDKPGKYPVIFMLHGAGEKSSNNGEYRAYLMDTVNKWVALGYMDPMVIVVPNIEREHETDNWSCYAFFYYVSEGRFGKLLNKIKSGECEFDDKVDHDSKFSVTGFSMGGVESLFIGTAYKNDIQNIGACSPSYMYYHVTGDKDDGWIKKKDVNFTSDPNAHLFMGYGANEESVFHENVDRYIGVYNENKTAEQQDFVVYGSYPDGHNWNTFSREIFCFVYYMKFDTLPDAETIEIACKNRNLDYGDDKTGDGSPSGDGKTGEDSGKESDGNKDTGMAKGSDDKSDSKAKYSNEWVDGKWYAANGDQTYEAAMSWKCNDTGWWIEDTSGWYPQSMWQKIDGNWYYFDESGYMAVNEWRDGWWLSSSGALTYNEKGLWQISGERWWFGDTSGWYAANMWQKINGCWYYFDSAGYIVTNQYVDGYWLGADGICW